jgi:hypothetical protein
LSFGFAPEEVLVAGVHMLESPAGSRRRARRIVVCWAAAALIPVEAV